ncbi:MAG: hypothetical protein DYH05_09240 [Acidobacteria bacterium ACB1]|nr:hypothetical protein [Acidobacteria bacterium ACB1]RIJ92519.1 MAG: hypothetical protein DCC44_07870 [Acidobacteriota bacterium]
MDEMFANEKEKRKFNPVFLVGILIGVLALGVAFYFLAQKPSIEDQTQQLLDTAYKPGSPEFAELNKDIIIATNDDETIESPTGLGTISMFIKGQIRNKGTHDISVLEVNVSVVDRQKQVVKERRLLFIPGQQPILKAGETVPVSLTLDGFSPKAERALIYWRVTAIKAAS